MRLHFARMPLKCYYVKTQNITSPSRVLLELIRDKWIEEVGAHPIGNDNGKVQNDWENPLDCKPLMTGKRYIVLLLVEIIDMFHSWITWMHFPNCITPSC